MTALTHLSRIAALGFTLFLLGCNQESAEALPEWTPADHTNQSKPSAGQIDTSKKRAGMDKLEAQGVNDVVFAAWNANCVRCHGKTGRGDGPEGRMFRPPDMTNPAWHRGRIDTEMKRTIMNGRGRMPAFKQLPEKTVDGLVQLIKMLNPEFHKKPAAAQKDAPGGDEKKPVEAPAKQPAAPQKTPAAKPAAQ